MCSYMVIFWEKKSIFDNFIWKKRKSNRLLLFSKKIRQMAKIQHKKKEPLPGRY